MCQSAGISKGLRPQVVTQDNKTMTIDEIATALKEWRGDNEDRSYLLIAVDDEYFTKAVQGSVLLLGGGLASAMNDDEQTERIVQNAMIFKKMDVFNDEDNDEE